MSDDIENDHQLQLLPEDLQASSKDGKKKNQNSISNNNFSLFLN